jgi:hypothetical protein
LEFEIQVRPEGAEAFVGRAPEGSPFVWEHDARFPGGGFPEAVAWVRERLDAPATGEVFVFRKATAREKRALGLVVHLPASVQVNAYRVQLRPVVGS